MEELFTRLDGIIPFLGGVLCTLLGFKIIPINKDPEKAEQWHKRFGLFMKIGGPFLAVYGLLKALLIL